MSPFAHKRHSASLAAAAAFFAFTLFATACGSDEPDFAVPTAGEGESDAADDGHGGGDAADDGHGEFSFGEPGEAGAADRVIDIDATDQLTFDPSNVTVVVGETVTFKIINTGKLPHDFTLGDSETQDDHDAEMLEMGDMAIEDEDPNATTIPAGETKELTWTFTEAGEIIMGCHIPGHYAGGMRGDITISESA